MYFLDYIAYRDLNGRVLGQRNKWLSFSVILVDEIVLRDNGKEIEPLKSYLFLYAVAQSSAGCAVYNEPDLFCVQVKALYKPRNAPHSLNTTA